MKFTLIGKLLTYAECHEYFNHTSKIYDVHISKKGISYFLIYSCYENPIIRLNKSSMKFLDYNIIFKYHVRKYDEQYDKK
jgi:hypothetical protein